MRLDITNNELDTNHVVNSTGYKVKIEILRMKYFDIIYNLTNNLSLKKKH